MPIKWKQRTSNDWVWVSNGRPNEKYWLGKRKEKSLVFFTSKNGGRAWHLTVSSLSYTLPLSCCVLMADGYCMTTRLWGHNHTGGACVCVHVCVCSLPVQYMDECEHYMCQQTGDSTAFINKNKKSLAPVVQKWGSKRGAGKNGRDRFHRQAWVFNTDTVVSFLYHSLSPFLAPWQSQQRAHTPVYAEVSQIIMKLRSQRGFPCVAANLSVCESECVCVATHYESMYPWILCLQKCVQTSWSV